MFYNVTVVTTIKHYFSSTIICDILFWFFAMFTLIVATTFAAITATATATATATDCSIRAGMAGLVAMATRRSCSTGEVSKQHCFSRHAVLIQLRADYVFDQPCRGSRLLGFIIR